MKPEQIDELTPKRRLFLGEALRCGVTGMHKARLRSLLEAGLLKQRPNGGKYYVPAAIKRAYAVRYNIDLHYQRRAAPSNTNAAARSFN
jgi:hypothetical protein